MMENVITKPPHQPVILRVLAHIISYVFHPLFIATYVTAFLVFIHPYAFAGLTMQGKVFRLLTVFVNTTFIPAAAVFLMWRLHFIDSLYLKTQKERIIPYAAAMICYFWVWYVIRTQLDNPDYFKSFLLGTFLGVCAGWFFNIYTKISMHGIAMGGLVTWFFLQAFSLYDATGLYFSIALLIAGLVCTARLMVSGHRPGEVYLGFFAGILCQLVAYWL